MLIHMGLTRELSIKDYWGDLDSTGTEYIVKKYISIVRFQQLKRYF